MTTNQIDKIFNQLDEWRNLPAYQLERRADIFFSIYLNDIFKSKFRKNVIHIIPEFPIRKSKNSNLSIKIDYVAVCDEGEKVYLIELKTDIRSRTKKQDEDLKEVEKNNLSDLVDGVLELSRVSKSKNKYKNLLSLLSKIGWINCTNGSNTNTIINKKYKLEIVYIQPTNDKYDENVISFNEIINILSDKQDVLTKRFLESLKKWTKNPNEDIDNYSKNTN